MTFVARRTRRTLVAVAPAFILLALPTPAAAQRPAQRDTTPTLGLDQGTMAFDAGGLRLELVRASQTVAALRPADSLQFDFTPGDRLAARSANGFYHLGDLNLRLRVDGGEWRAYSTAAERQPVTALEVGDAGGSGASAGSVPPGSDPAGSQTTGTPAVLAAADLSPTLPADIPLRVRRFWEVRDGRLALRFELTNTSPAPVEIGALGIPMVFDNILTDRSLDEAHAVASFHDPYIGQDAGYVRVTRLKGKGPALVVAPLGHTPLEAWRPLLDERTRRGITFEGFYEWMPLSRAYAEKEWSDAEPWNPPSSDTLAPGASRSYGVVFLVSPTIRAIEPTLLADGRPVAVGVPGYVVPSDLDAKLFLKRGSGADSLAAGVVDSITVEPAGALTFEPARDPTSGATNTPGGWLAYDVRGVRWGRARAVVHWADGLEQAIAYRVIDPMAAVVDSLGAFLTTEQWFDVPDDPFGRSPSVISYDYDTHTRVTEDNRAWIAGLSDEGGAGSWLAAVMKQLVRPDAGEVAKLQRFVDSTLWGGIQYADGEHRYGVRKSLFYYAPDDMPPGTYHDSVGYGGWSSWDREQAESTGRSYDYPHVAAAHWALYRLARDHEGLVTNHPWAWYLERAYQTGQAMVREAGYYAQFGQMEGTVFVLILADLRREGWTEQADALEATMRARAEVWRSLGYPFGSEMPWDSTGQEEVYAWCSFFGFDEKATVTLNAILGYMPAVPSWGYNGSARRYWDFVYAGKLRRVERQLHHYGSALNAIPVLSAYREHPDDVYLLRVGYAGMMGALANVTRDGFAPAAFHAWPSTLRIDGYSGDYGPGFFGLAVNTGTYLVRDRELGWLAFGGTVRVLGGGGGATSGLTGGAAGDAATSGLTGEASGEAATSRPTGGGQVAGAAIVTLEPRDAARARVYLAPLGLWLTLDAGTFRSVALTPDGVRVTLDPATAATPRALLRVEQPAEVPGVGTYVVAGDYGVERGAAVIPLGPGATEVWVREGGGGGGGGG